MIEAQADVIEVARKTQSTKDNNHYARFPLERTIIEPGSYVLAHYENDSKRSPNKVTPHLRGPFLVLNPSPCYPNVYAVQNLVSEKIEDFHLKNLRPFFHDPAITSPSEIARKVLDYVEIRPFLSEIPEVSTTVHIVLLISLTLKAYLFKVFKLQESI